MRGAQGISTSPCIATPLRLPRRDKRQSRDPRVRMTDMENSEITSAFLQARGKWTGCHWSTRFGSQKLNLQGLKSSQAVMMARSTAGKEAAEWKAATRWLEQVEHDADQAETEAGTAAQLAMIGQYEQAAKHARKACDLQARYCNDLVWQPLLDAITSTQRILETTRSPSPDGSPNAADIPASRRQS
jgi:hypothetical protein